MNKRKKPDFSIELSYSSQFAFIAGVDEVGRGAIAGPIVAGAVIFNDYSKLKRKLKGIDDSKKLDRKRREEYLVIIKSLAHDYAIGEVSPKEIDLIGIGAANILAFQRVLNNLKKCDFALIDGRKFRGFDYKFSCFEKGESLSLSIASASILAKQYRDHLMEDLSLKYEQYMFHENVGYGGKKHYEALIKYGPTDIHRVTFLNKFKLISQQQNLFR